MKFDHSDHFERGEQTHMSMKRVRFGFTLVELLVVHQQAEVPVKESEDIVHPVRQPAHKLILKFRMFDLHEAKWKKQVSCLADKLFQKCDGFETIRFCRRSSVGNDRDLACGEPLERAIGKP